MEARIATISDIADRNLQNAGETEQSSGSLAKEASGAGGLHGGVEGENVGLEGDVLDVLGNLGNLLRVGADCKTRGRRSSPAALWRRRPSRSNPRCANLF